MKDGMIDLRYGRCCLESLREMPEKSVHVCVTSPPYYGLRNYGIPPSIWGGDPACVHEWTDASWRNNRWGVCDDDKPGEKQKTNAGALGHRGKKKDASTCCKCGSWKGHLGLEPTVEMFVQHLVLVFDEVWRVLRDDGTLWLNMGDSYHTDSPVRMSSGEAFSKQWDPTQTASRGGLRKSAAKSGVFKNKDLIGAPWLVAFALRAAGWYLRSAMPWIKRNPMPDSTEDRPGQAVEYVFLLSKKDRYFYDHEAVKVKSTGKGGGASFGKQLVDSEDTGAQSRQYDRPDYKNRNFRNADLFFKSWQGLLSDDEGEPMALVVNPRSFRGAHFAVWPEALVEPMIQAGTSEKGCCPTCGKQWQRVVKSVPVPHPSPRGPGKRPTIDNKGGNQANGSAALAPEVTTLGWEPACKCEAAEPIPSTVLDPFAGSATTCATAFRLGRKSIGLDASTEYEAIARERCGGLFLANGAG